MDKNQNCKNNKPNTTIEKKADIFIQRILRLYEFIQSRDELCNKAKKRLEYLERQRDNTMQLLQSMQDMKNSRIQDLQELIQLFENDDKLKYYIDKYEYFKIDSISKIITNKCIVDPLGRPISDINNIRIDVSEVNDRILNELNKNPTDLYKLSSRRFEELIAEILLRKGYNIELTPITRDGGKDIYAAYKNDLGSFLYVVECKKYISDHKVGVKVLRDLYGILSKEKATYGIVATTSYFTKPAKEFQQDLYYQMSIQDFDSIRKWLSDITQQQ